MILHGPHHSAHVSMKMSLFSLSPVSRAESKTSFLKLMDCENAVLKHRQNKKLSANKGRSINVINGFYKMDYNFLSG
jgi:hypothetical protein